MVFLNYIIIGVLVIFLIRSLFLVLRDMDGKRKRIMNGIILLFVSFIIYSSLISYILWEEIRGNFGGIVGQYIAENIYRSFGLSSYILPFILVIGAIALLTERVKKIFYIFGGLYIWIFFLTILIQSIVPNISKAYRGEIPTIVGGFFIDNLNVGGSIALIVFLALLIIYIYLHNIIHFDLSLLKRFFKNLSGRRKIKSTHVNEEIEVKSVRREKKKVRKEKTGIKEMRKTHEIEARKKVSRKISDDKSLESYLINDEEYRERFLKILKDPVEKEWMKEETIKKYKEIIENKLENFGITGNIVNVLKGPVITRFEYKPDPGIKLSKISNLSNDLALALKAEKIRVIAPIPGKGVVGIEVPNANREIVYIKDLIGDKHFRDKNEITYIPVGKDITGNPVYSSISSMPHLLIAGATGSGKSIFINSIITSLIFKAKPSDLRFIMIDPKRIELSIYNGIPHLLRSVITERATSILFLTKALECMEKRYEEFARVGVRDIVGYNRKMKDRKPYIFIVVDELADLMMRSGKEVENAIIRLAQMSRAVGIHLILATQRPSVDVITGLIKANFPARIAFQVASRHDSKTIMDFAGAEQLLGNGDMLFIPPDEGMPRRLHGPFVTTEETKDLVHLISLRHLRNLIKGNFPEPDIICSYIRKEEVIDVISDRTLPGSGERIEEFSKLINNDLGIEEEKFTEFIENLDYYPPTEEIEEFLEIYEAPGELDEVDELYEEAKRIVIDRQSASVSLLQRKLRVGYARAGRIIDQLEKTGIVGKFRGSKPREVLIKREDKE